MGLYVDKRREEASKSGNFSLNFPKNQFTIIIIEAIGGITDGRHFDCGR